MEQWRAEVVLLIPAKYDSEREAVARAWVARGGKVLSIAKFWKRPELGEVEVSLYGFDTFCQVLAQQLGVVLESPREELLAQLAKRWVKRRMVRQRLGELAERAFPCFVKPLVPKSFPAAVYASRKALAEATQGLGMEVGLMVSEVVVVEREVRCFVLAGKVLDLAFYEGEGEVALAREWVQTFLAVAPAELPRAYVLDLGFSAERGWFILEFNAAWGAGLNGCQAERVIAAIRAASH